MGTSQDPLHGYGTNLPETEATSGPRRYAARHEAPLRRCHRCFRCPARDCLRCGREALAPGGGSGGAQETASQKEGTFKLSLVGSEEDLNALFNEGAPLTEEDRQGLNLLRNGHIVVSRGNDKFGLDVKAGDLEHAFELRYRRQEALRPGRRRRPGQAVRRLARGVQRGRSGLASQEGFEFLAAAVAGKWLEADFSALKGPVRRARQAVRLKESRRPEESTPAASGASRAEASTRPSRTPSGRPSPRTSASRSSSPTRSATTTWRRSPRFAAPTPSSARVSSSTWPSRSLPAASSRGQRRPRQARVVRRVGQGRPGARIELDLAQLSPAPPPASAGWHCASTSTGSAAALTAPSDAVPVDIAGLIGEVHQPVRQLPRGFGSSTGVQVELPGGAAQYD